LFRLDIGGATSAGRVRDRNEDSYLIQQLSWSNLDQRQEIALVVVADGMGGHNAGERASGLIIQQLGANLAGLLGGALSGQIREVSPASLCGSLLTAIKGANKAVYQKGQSEPGCRGMGATLAVVLIWNGMVVIGHVGDTRVYCLRSGRLSQLTKDQTLVSRMVEKGLLTAEEAARHPSRNEISQAVGRQPEVEPAFYQIQLMLGDWLVVACDGLHAHVDHPALEKHLREAVPSADWLAHRLVEVANQGGGSDNTTVVAIRCY
jgi:protein phosphatase